MAGQDSGGESRHDEVPNPTLPQFACQIIDLYSTGGENSVALPLNVHSTGFPDFLAWLYENGATSEQYDFARSRIHFPFCYSDEPIKPKIHGDKMGMHSLIRPASLVTQMYLNAFRGPVASIAFSLIQYQPLDGVSYLMFEQLVGVRPCVVGGSEVFRELCGVRVSREDGHESEIISKLVCLPVESSVVDDFCEGVRSALPLVVG